MPTSPLPRRRDLGWVAVGGAVGALARVAVATWSPTADSAFPWTTLGENVAGAFMLAVVLTVLAERLRVDPRLRLLVGTGALGAFTTYSTLAVETERLLSGGRPGLAAVYAAGSTVAGLAMAVLGLRLGRALRSAPRADGRAAS